MKVTFKKTFQGTEVTFPDGSQQIRSFKFEVEDIDKYIVLPFRYEEHMFYGNLLGTQLEVNNHKLTNQDKLFGIYKIEWHNDWCDLSYKIKLTPINNFKAWCPNRSWYTSDIESLINCEYNLYAENPIFTDLNEASEFVIKKNYELYN